MPLPIIPKNSLPIIQLEHNCDLCSTGTKCCCSSFDVCITADEVGQIIGVLPQVSKYVPQLIGEDGNFENVFEEEPDGLFSVDTHDDGLCIFAYHHKGETRCSLHSVALDMKLPINKVKPLVCILWPLAISDGPEPSISVDSYAFDFHCNHKKPPRSAKLSDSIRESLQTLWGDEIVRVVENNAK